MRVEVPLPQELADKHTLLAQHYAGYLIGHPYRNFQQTSNIQVDKKPWREPHIIKDSCLFCSRLTDAEAIARVAGFQYQLDFEVLRRKRHYFNAWFYPDGIPANKVYAAPDRATLRKFCISFQDMPTEKRPHGWQTRPLPFVDLPIRLKRKLCIEWNHLYRDWMAETGTKYDFDTKEFYRDEPDPQPDSESEGC